MANETYVPTAATPTPVASGAQLGEVVTALQREQFVDIYLRGKCGELGVLACLCDPLMMQAADALLKRFTSSERQAILRMACGCAVPQTQPAQPQPTVNNGGVIPVVNPAPTTPTQQCYQGLPPQGSFTNG